VAVIPWTNNVEIDQPAHSVPYEQDLYSSLLDIRLSDQEANSVDSDQSAWICLLIWKNVKFAKRFDPDQPAHSTF
jgi:hypothetical protein